MNCAETSGFLFHHDCGREADATCQLCGKFVCALHTRTAEGQILCITCLKRFLKDRGTPPGQQPAQPQQPQQPARQGLQEAAYYSSPWYTYDDPYWYTDRHYPSYHEHDFTAEDRKAFETGPQPGVGTGAAEEAFETDKEAS